MNIAVLLDRDLLEACESSKRSVSVPFEEISHFVYLSFNHNRGRNITTLEMEIQSEVDRILLAFDARFELAVSTQNELLKELLEIPYADRDYEFARRSAANFLRQLSGGNPRGMDARTNSKGYVIFFIATCRKRFAVLRHDQSSRTSSGEAKSKRQGQNHGAARRKLPSRIDLRHF